ncbi:MAG: peptidoglycan-binding domain-containing protein [Candidatus Omnitrophica bacterium]|nr:peptidoglycan-binding domain-containing protein [Candidatus Omnitrophota bacterium]
MKKFVFIVLAVALTAYLYGCGKKQQTLEEMQQPMSMETITTMSATTPEAKAPEVKPETVTVVAPGTPAKLEPLAVSSSTKPTAIDIQAALKNAGFYTGKVDGKIGPMTKKAISEFQKANNLEADGKVGAKTWTALSRYLNSSTPAAAR